MTADVRCVQTISLGISQYLGVYEGCRGGTGNEWKAMAYAAVRALLHSRSQRPVSDLLEGRSGDVRGRVVWMILLANVDSLTTQVRV